MLRGVAVAANEVYRADQPAPIQHPTAVTNIIPIIITDQRVIQQKKADFHPSSPDNADYRKDRPEPARSGKAGAEHTFNSSTESRECGCLMK